MTRLLLPFLVSLLISLPSFAQQNAPEITDLLFKYRKIQSGKISWKETTISSFVTDSSSQTAVVYFQKNQRKAKSYKGYDIFTQYTGEDFKSTRLMCQDSIYFFNDSVLFVRSGIKWPHKEHFKDEARAFPVMESMLFFGKMTSDDMALVESNDTYWKMKGKEYQLLVRKKDSMIVRIELDVTDKIGHFYKRMDIIDQAYGMAFPTDAFPFSPDSILSSLSVYKRDDNRPEASSLVGQQAPDWTLANLDGDSISLADLKGKYVLLDFWYIGCGPCAFAMPELQKISEQFDP